MLRKMAIPGERMAEEDSVESYPEPAPIRDVVSVEPYPGLASPGDIVESTHDSDIGSPGPSIQSPLHTSGG